MYSAMPPGQEASLARKILMRHDSSDTKLQNMVQFLTQVGHADLRKSIFFQDSKESLSEKNLMLKRDALSEGNILADNITWVHSRHFKIFFLSMLLEKSILKVSKSSVVKTDQRQCYILT